jgi:hypothetical protein
MRSHWACFTRLLDGGSSKFPPVTLHHMFPLFFDAKCACFPSSISRHHRRHVSRSWQWERDGTLLPVVAAVDEPRHRRAGPGDVLVLKGHKWGGDGSYLGE